MEDINKDLASIEGLRGPCSKYTLPAENRKGKVDFKFDEVYMEGIACSLDSIGFKSLSKAIENVLGSVKPFSISGSLPLVRDLQRSGFDLILVGFGRTSVYHGDNEYCLLSDMSNAIKILSQFIYNVEEATHG